MKKIYFTNCNKYRKFKNPKILNTFYKTLLLPIICDKCGSKDETIFEENQLRYKKLLVLLITWKSTKLIYSYLKLDEKNISQEFRLKNIDERENYFIEEIKQNELISKKHQKVSTTLSYSKHFLVLFSAFTGPFSISSFAFLAGIPIEIPSSAVGLKICAITAAIKMYKSIIKKKEKKHDKMVLLAKPKLNSTDVLTSKASIDSYISHDEFVLINNVLTEYDDMKKEIKNLKTSAVYQRF